MQATIIKDEEIRVGNWLVYEGYKGKKFVKVTDIFNGGINMINDNYEVSPEYDLAQLQPIPLTPEILEKCGFVQNLLTAFRLTIAYLTNLYLHNDEGDKYNTAIECMDGDAAFMYLPSEIKYLHQLQNLYFALTNQELQINL
jgi:hypothetical protein